MMISGKTTVIAHLGYPTEAFKAPMIYNPYFDHAGIDAVVIPMGIKVEDYPAFLRPLFTMTNLRGALVTMPHKVSTVARLDEVTPTPPIAGACLSGIGLFDAHGTAADALGNRLREHYPALTVRTGSNDPEGYDVVVNATPLGMKPGDPLPMDVARIAPGTFVGEVVMMEEYTPFLRAAMEKGCPVQVGTDMLFEQIPAYLEFFGFKTTTPEQLRELSQIKYQ